MIFHNIEESDLTIRVPIRPWERDWSSEERVAMVYRQECRQGMQACRGVENNVL